MNQWKVSLIISMVILACANTGCGPGKKTIKEQEIPPSSLYELPKTVDFEKAARLNVELGLEYLKQEQVARAKSKLNRAKKLAPQLPEVHYSYGYFLEHVGEIKEAEKSYKKAISLNPKGGKEHNNYGAFLCRQREFKHAEKEFHAAVSDPHYTHTAEALENAGLCVQQIPDFAKAKEYYEKALRYDSKRENALLEMAFINFQEGKLSDAWEYHNRHAKTAQPTARSLLLGIQLAKHVGDKDKEASYQLLLNSQFPQPKANDGGVAKKSEQS